MEPTEVCKKVLLIDDDPVTNMINTKLIMREFNFIVEAYTNAQETLIHLQNLIISSPDKIPDIIFLDINMPVMDGWQFLDEFEKLPATLVEKAKIFMLTSSIDADDILKARAYGSVSDFISKPLTSNKIRLLIKEPHDEGSGVYYE
ncbi:MAG: response regulator [Chryseolinea sp.]